MCHVGCSALLDGVLGVDGIEAGGAAQSRETVVHHDPARSIVKVHVHFGVPVDRVVHGSESDLDPIGVPGRLEEQRAAASTTEAARTMIG